MSASRVRVVVVDDDALVRTGLRLMLGGSDVVELVGEAGDGHEGLTVVERERPDVVLMDIRMPGLDGLAATRRLTERGSNARVIVLTTFDTDEMVLTALRHGAAGFLLKDTPPAELVDAVVRVARGEPMLSPSVTAQVITAATRTPDDTREKQASERVSRLTDREREVAIAIGRGLSNAEIAAELYLGLATVKTHIGRLFTKLEASNRVQIALCVHDAGLT
ncbi:two component transcriptional regulator, LuxR family [Georgenia satyanarayanai]|uniref:Two component transcriptional regulator, LuxR family n=1 Tax=Georgenia satyanarayanai TaxID=860221 RepID=A0A2Y8ZY21_9MICO|nr:response regulator transcription factor [Georgenia satyanarayanai]PYG02167.1 LuxR family two component transcriptional regulator [Georgenia satyanarayanai]SSA36984.1 two component transcriptional regulator, LuxR family [Georgenia satyanarayanai]